MKNDLHCLIGKYLNGYKIVRIEDDPFIKGQINLFTDEWEYEAFNDKSLVKFFVRNESNTSKIYKELIDEENYNLKQALREIREVLDNEIVTPSRVTKLKNVKWGNKILKIIDKNLIGDKTKYKIEESGGWNDDNTDN